MAATAGGSGRGCIARVRLECVRSVRVTLAAGAPGGGDSGPLISRCACFRLPSGERRRKQVAREREKLCHLESFTLWRAEVGRGLRKRDPPPSKARRAGGGKGGDGVPHPPRGWCQFPPRPLEGPVGQTESDRDERTRAGAGAWVSSPPARTRRGAANARLSHGPGRARVGRGGAVRGRSAGFGPGRR